MAMTLCDYEVKALYERLVTLDDKTFREKAPKAYIKVIDDCTLTDKSDVDYMKGYIQMYINRVC